MLTCDERYKRLWKVLAKSHDCGLKGPQDFISGRTYFRGYHMELLAYLWWFVLHKKALFSQKYVIYKEVQIVYRLWIATYCMYLIGFLPSQLAMWEVKWLIELARPYIAMTRNNLCIISISLVIPIHTCIYIIDKCNDRAKAANNLLFIQYSLSNMNELNKGSKMDLTLPWNIYQ